MKLELTMKFTIDEPDEHGVPIEEVCARVHRRLTRYTTDEIKDKLNITEHHVRFRGLEVKPA